ncbi:MAG TPA: hypothetical protein VNL94_05815 [Candidatus Binatia bacterium]|nr:hypothetical protein [Candidatus Binatia bacterium]
MHELTVDARGSVVRWTEVPGRDSARVFVDGLGGTSAPTFWDVATHPRLGGHRTLLVGPALARAQRSSWNGRLARRARRSSGQKKIAPDGGARLSRRW